MLITPGLVPWVKAADILPGLKGSDHCPVYIDLHDEITDADGAVTRLSDVLGARSVAGEPAEPPRLAAKYWDEFKQKLLSTFFGKKSDERKSGSPLSASQTPALGTPQNPENLEHTGQSTITSVPDDLLIQPSSASEQVPVDPPSATTKRRLVADDTKSSTKKARVVEPRKTPAKQNGKSKPGAQATLAGFFAQPKATGSKGSSSSKAKAKSASSPPAHEPPDTEEDADYQFALQLSQAEDNVPPLSSQGSSSGESKQKWTSLLAPTKAPNCTAHNEPAKEFTVGKPGPNKGKRFFSCARYVQFVFYASYPALIRMFCWLS